MPNTTRLTELPGGLRVVTCEMPHAETASMALWTSVGGRHEPVELNGISHFIEHMLFKGTQRRSPRKIMQEIEGIGGDINAYTSEERTCYYATAAAEFFPRIADVLCDIYTQARFSPTDIDRERGVIAEEILMYRDEPSSHVQEMLNATFWQDHPLGRPLTGTAESIAAMDRDTFCAYRQSHYHRANTVVSAAGRIRHDDVIAAVEKLLASLPHGTRTAPAEPPRLPGSPRLTAEARDVQQTQVALAVPAMSHFDERRYALMLLNTILGGNASSRLFQEVREKRGICYSVSSHVSTFDDCGTLSVSIGLDRKNLERTLDLVLAAFETLRTRPVGPAELRRAKEYSIGSRRMSLERASSQNMRIGSSVLTYGQAFDPEVVHEKIRRVSAEDVRAIAGEVLDPTRLCLAVIGPDPDTAMLEKYLS